MTLTLTEGRKLYLEALRQAGKNPRTLYTYGKDLEQVEAFFGPDKAVDSITAAQLGKFLKSEALLRLPGGSERAPQTVAKTVRVLRMFLFWLKENGYIDTVPVPRGVPLGRNSVK